MKKDRMGSVGVFIMGNGTELELQRVHSIESIEIER